MDENKIKISFEETEIKNEMDNIEDINKMIDELKEENNITDLEYWDSNYWNVFHDESYYMESYTIKDLLKICEYYGIEKDVKSAKCKKQEIIATIIYFEGLDENYEIVEKRNRLWTYMDELQLDQKMKKYIIWK